MTNSTTNRFHLCLSPDAIEGDPGLLALVRDAGISDIWVTGFLYGYWYYSLERILACRRAVEAMGMGFHIGNVPLGHPGDSLGAQSGDVPLSPPPHWRMGVKADGAQHSGTSLHPPAVEENCQALQRLQAAGIREVFLDDDYRLAVTPGMIGGCFCPEHRRRFLETHGLNAAQWETLLHDVQARAFTPLLRQWVDFTCDELSDAFRRQQAAAPQIELGIMVMYLGSEKAGIRLEDYRAAPLRVGEFMFDDAGFSPVKGKTDELFSVLFHRRFCDPQRAYSESTAFPANGLSAPNLAAKLVTSLIGDVRNSMLMSGLSPYPRDRWPALAQAIQRQARLAPLTAGLQPRGPLKHTWGLASRYSGDDTPYSLFLALGVPFEVVAQPQPGWNFLSQADALEQSQAGPAAPGVQRVHRPGDCPALPGGLALEENLPALFAFKRQILPQLAEVPYILEDQLAVCAWYPEANRALVWNLSETRETFTLRYRQAAREITLAALDVTVVDLA